MSKHGKDFEQAVYAFSQTLDPQATVIFNHFRPDRDTGEPRQCDVWIEATFGGHWPLSILVSCKDHGRKLHSGDIGAFINEKESTGASTGIIYSRAGFYKPALAKAKSNGLSCCRLYKDQPADFPEVVLLNHFLAKARIQIELLSNPNSDVFMTWNDIFDISINGTQETLLQTIATGVTEAEKQISEDFKQTRQFDPTSACLNEICLTDEKWKAPLRINVLVFWAIYQGKLESCIVNGSYCFTNKSFVGRNSGPSIDTQSASPGEGWQEISITEHFKFPQNHVLAILFGLKIDVVSDLIREAFGSRPLQLLES